MPRPKKERGRPLERLYPPRIDATAEDIAKAMFAMPADHKWQYEAVEGGAVYRCGECGEAVYYPATLYQDGRCSDCRSG